MLNGTELGATLVDDGPGTAPAGVLPAQALERCLATGIIATDEPPVAGQVQPASLDLRLGAVAYRVRASFFPGQGASVLDRIADLQIHEMDLARPAVLERGCVYIVPLLERLALPPSLAGKANPKSTTGRLDVFTRLLADADGGFDQVPAGYAGPLYVEIIPRTFSVLVRRGTRLNQLRLVQDSAQVGDAALAALHAREPLVYEEGCPAPPALAGGLLLSVDLAGRTGSAIIGYRAKRHAPLVDLDRVGYYDPAEFWDPLPRPAHGRLILDPDEFYLLASRERIRVPSSLAAELVSYDPALGEFRVHYAGFFDPGFGAGAGIRGSHAVLEVRVHGVPFVLEDAQRIGRLVYERLVEPPDRLYGPTIGSTYQGQLLALGKQFRQGW
jgi:dCTP deaminase